jgi:hypothetical protein
VTYLDSKVLSDFPQLDTYGDPVNFKGEAFPNTPKWSFSAGARYDWALNADLSAFAGAQGSYQSATVNAFGNQAGIAQGFPSVGIKDYGLLDLSAGLASENGRWSLEFWGHNVTNTYYWVTVNYQLDSVSRLAGAPATFGVTFRYKY